ncbi:YcjA [Escherichia coli]|nr:YcjA [Escherichia coli]CTV06755.1 YcjA [Escherichia coli]
MYCTVKEIIREVLDTDVPDSECVFAVVLTRGDVRHIAQDWSLTDDELETVMQRLDDAFEHGADVSVVHDVVRELMEEKHASRQVTVPAVMLEKVMALAGSEMKRLYAVGSENGGDGDAFVREEREAMDVVLQALAGLVMTVLTVGLVSCAGKSLPRFWPGDFFPVFYACHLAVLGVLAL